MWKREAIEAVIGRPLTVREVAELNGTATGGARIVMRAEAARCSALLDRATPPEGCGEAIPVAPGRGACRVVVPVRLVSAATGRTAHDGWQGRNAVAAADVFDRMAASAARRREAAPFSAAQVEVARAYRGLVERRAAGGLRCASLEAGVQGGQPGGGSFIDAWIADGRRLEAMRDRIGGGAALSPRRRGACGEGSPRRLSDRVLVDLVVLRDWSVSHVLRRHGWSLKRSHRAACRDALAAALERMRSAMG